MFSIGIISQIVFFFFFKRDFQSMVFAPNDRSLIQLSKILSVELTRTYHIVSQYKKDLYFDRKIFGLRKIYCVTNNIIIIKLLLKH